MKIVFEGNVDELMKFFKEAAEKPANTKSTLNFDVGKKNISEELLRDCGGISLNRPFKC